MEAIYAVRFRDDVRAMEYVVVPEKFAFGVIWDMFTDNRLVYWYNDKKEAVIEISKKVDSTDLRKSVIIDDARLQEISDIGRSYSTYESIGGRYAYLVRRLIEELGSLY